MFHVPSFYYPFLIDPLRQIGGEVDREIPPSLVEAWGSACKTKSEAAKNKLFTAWLAAGGEWGQLHGCSKVVYCNIGCIAPHTPNICKLAKVESEGHANPYRQGHWTVQGWSWPRGSKIYSRIYCYHDMDCVKLRLWFPPRLENKGPTYGHVQRQHGSCQLYRASKDANGLVSGSS